MKEKEREREREYRCSRQRLYGRSEYSSEPPPAVNWNSLEAYADWSARHFSDFNDNRIMMITPFTERTCYLFLSTSFSLSFSPSLSLLVQLFISMQKPVSSVENGELHRSCIVRSIRVFFSHAILDAILTAALTAEHPERVSRWWRHHQLHGDSG